VAQARACTDSSSKWNKVKHVQNIMYRLQRKVL
jgi:hypothetical protein